MKVDEQLLLKNQICFRIYSLERAIQSAYKPLLNELDVTYPQYLTLLVLWEHRELTISEICDHLGLDTGTVSPLLKRMEQKGLLKRERAPKDERTVIVTLTPEGLALRNRAEQIPSKLASCLFTGSADDVSQTYSNLRNELDRALEALRNHNLCSG